MEGGRPFRRIVLPDHVGDTRRQLFLCTERTAETGPLSGVREAADREGTGLLLFL